jgi:superoxide dismutase, Fe-Mn family
MSSFTTKDLKNIIKESLGVDESSKSKINEAYVAQPKQYRLQTELLSDATKSAHLELYDGYVKEFNRISAELDAVDTSSANPNHSKFRSLKIDEAYNLNAIYLHELYFSNISDLHSELKMDSLSFMRLQRDFGTFDAWQKDFIACCKSSRCGWAITGYNTFLQRYVNCVIDLHSMQVPVGFFPIIVMDMWQHAYYRDYVNDAQTYVIAMMKQLDWAVIEERFEKSEKLGNLLR